MVVTVLLSGIPRVVNLEDLARGLDQCLKSDEIGSFVARDLPYRSRNGRRMVALDFKTGFDAMIAQDILNGYEYALPDQEYVLTAKVTSDRMYMPDNVMVDRLATPPPPIYSEALVAYTSRREEIERSHEDLNDEIHTLQQKLLVITKKTQLIEAKNKLKMAKKSRKRRSHRDSSDRSEPRRKRKKKRSHIAKSSPSPSPVPSTSTGKLRATGHKKASRSRSLDSSSSSDSDMTRKRRRPNEREESRGSTSRRRSPKPSTSRRSPLRSSRGFRSKRSPTPGLRSKRLPTPVLRPKRSPSHCYRCKRTPSPDIRSRRTPSPTHRPKRSPTPGLRSKRSPTPVLRPKRSPSPCYHCKRTPSPDLRSRRTPSPDLRSRRPSRWCPPSPTHRPKRSPSPGLRAKRSPTPGYSKSSLHSPIYRRRSPSSCRSRPSPYNRERSQSGRSPNSPLRSRHNSPTSPYTQIQSSPRRPPRYKHFDIFTELYRMMKEKSAEQPPSSNPGIVIVRSSISTLRPPPATITEIQENNDIWGEVDQLAEVLESERVAESSYLEQLEDGEEEGNDPSADEDRPKINVTINVVKKNATDLERDKRYLAKIKEEIQKCKSPKKKKIGKVGQVKKDLVLDKDLNPEQLRKVMPKPLVVGVKIKEELDIDIVKSEDDDVIDVKVIKNVKEISPNPKFVIVIKKVIKEMRCHTVRVDADMKNKFFGILRKILRLRIKELLEGKDYMKWRGVFELYRQNYDTEQDGELVASVFNAMLDGNFADYVPSDDEDYDSGREDEHLFLPYIPGKKKKMENKENVPNKNDDEVVILEEHAEVIAITDSEDDDCTIVKKPDDAPDVSAVITNAHVKCEKEPKIEESDNASKLLKTWETLDMKCNEEKDHAGGVPLSGKIGIVLSEIVVDSLEGGRVKVELPSSGDIIDLDDDIDIVKIENEEVDVKSEASTVELNDIATYGDNLSNSVMSEPNTDCHEMSTTGKESGNCLQSVAIKSEPSREDLIDEILKLTETKLTETYTKDSKKGSSEFMQTMKEISKGSICEVKSETDRTKDSCQAMVAEPEKTVESIEKSVYNFSAERDDFVLDSDGNLKQDTKVTNNKQDEQNPKQVMPNNTVKTEPEESVETIGNFVNQATTVVDESNLDSDDDVKQDAKATDDEPNGQNSKQGVRNKAVKTERPEEESVESIEKFLDLVTNVNVID